MATYEQLRAAQRKAHDAGDKVAAKRYTERIANREYDDSISNWRSGLRGFNQGTALGMGEEIESGIAALFSLGDSGIIGPSHPDRDKRGFFDRYLDRYNIALQSSREDLEASQREDPWITGLSELAGGIVTTGIGGASAVTKGRSLQEGARKLMTQGAKIGGAAGYGHSEYDPLQAALSGADSDVFLDELGGALGDTAKMTAIGGGMGFAMPFVGAGLRTVGKGAINKVAKWINNPGTKNAEYTEEARKLIAKSFNEDLASGEITLAQVKREMAEVPGMTIADLSPAVRELAETASQTSTPGGRMLRKYFTERHAGQEARVSSRLMAEIGSKDETLYVATKKLTQQMEEQGDKLYREAYKEITEISPEMARLFSNPEMKKALIEIRRLNKAEFPGSDLPLLNVGELLTGRDADIILRGLQQHVDGLFSGASAKKALGHVVKKNLLSPIKETMLDSLPALRNARKVWGDSASLKDAVEAGKRVFLDTAEVTADIVSNMTGAQKKMFKLSVLNQIMRKVGGKSDTQNIIKGIFDTTNKKDALRAAFDTTTQFDDFMRYIQQEATMAETFTQSIANSATMRRLSQQTVGEGKALAGAIGYEGGIRSSLLGPQSARYIGQQVNKFLGSEAKETARMNAQSMAQAQRIISPNVESLMQPKTLGGLLDTGVPQSVSTGLQGLLATDTLNPNRWQ